MHHRTRQPTRCSDSPDGCGPRRSAPRHATRRTATWRLRQPICTRRDPWTPSENHAGNHRVNSFRFKHFPIVQRRGASLAMRDASCQRRNFCNHQEECHVVLPSHSYSECMHCGPCGSSHRLRSRAGDCFQFCTRTGSEDSSRSHSVFRSPATLVRLHRGWSRHCDGRHVLVVVSGGAKSTAEGSRLGRRCGRQRA